MFRVNIGHHGNRCREPVEGAVTFVGLNHHPLTLPHACVRTVGVNYAAVDNSRVDTARIQQRADHGCCCGFAVGSRDGHVRFQAHQFRQHFGAAHNRQALRTCCIVFSVTGFDRTRDHHNIRILKIFSSLPDENFSPQTGQTIRDFGCLQVRALHSIAMVQKHFGNAGHANAANPHKVKRA